MVPDGWEIATVADVCTLRNGRGFRPEEWGGVGLPIIRIQNLNGNRTFNRFAGKVESRFLVEPGQMLFAWAGTKGVSFGPTVWTGERGVLNQHIFKIHRRGDIDDGWLYATLRHVTDRIERKAHGFKSTLVHVKKPEIEQQPILLPPRPEQKKIAEILSTWDKAIATNEKLLVNAAAQKRALMQQLLTGKRRLKGFERGEWKRQPLDAVFERVRQKNTAGNQNVLTISGRDGLVSQSHYFNKIVAASDTSGYTLIQGGDFAYNKSYSAGYPLGAIKMLPLGHSGVLSSLYICFRIKNKTRDHFDFYRHWFEFGGLNRELSVIAQEGARNHGLLNVGLSEFFKLLISRPDAEEQREIAALLNDAELQVRNAELQLCRLGSEKRSIMQQLLTGKRRVRV